MYLKELTINGFKSFAKKSELEFSAPITAIVGPNGSGKSNVAESFRFVLGEQSVKSMRGKRGEDLIWGGSESVSRANRASVRLVFDNRKRLLALDFDEVTIERIVHRDGQNEYKLNGSAVRLKDVHELLAGANIGATGHHIISQGEADRVLAAGPAERREMIEDALGLKVYQLKKQETKRKLEKTEANIKEVESLRREAAPHLRYLKKQVDKAERALELQKELAEKYAEYLKREDVYVACRHDALTKNRQEPAEALESVTEKIAAAKETIAATEVESTSPPELQKAKTALQETRQKRQEKERELSQLEGQLSLLSRRLNAAKQAQEDRSGGVVDRDELESLVGDLEQAAEKALSKGGEAALGRALSDLVHQLRTFLKREVQPVSDTTADDAAEKERLESAQKEAAAALQAAQEAEAKCQSALEAAEAAKKEENRDAERELFSLLNEERELRSTLQSIDRELSVLERDRADFKQQLQEAVALLGRKAAEYFNHEVRDAQGTPLPEEDIAGEEREKQRERQRELEKLKIRLEELGIGATEELMQEYKEAKERDEFLARELEDLNASVENLTALIADMDEKLHEHFSAGLQKITTEFHKFFTLMFGGGAASLEQVTLKQRGDEEAADEAAPATGVELSVSLPNKRVKGLDMLSGGERALTSIALIFAMSQVNPPPFIILDETDAALDEANSRRYGDMIEALAKRSQLVLITHNRETMSRAGILFGITMGADGVSKVLSVKFDEAAAVAK